MSKEKKPAANPDSKPQKPISPTSETKPVAPPARVVKGGKENDRERK